MTQTTQMFISFTSSRIIQLTRRRPPCVFRLHFSFVGPEAEWMNSCKKWFFQWHLRPRWWGESIVNDPRTYYARRCNWSNALAPSLVDTHAFSRRSWGNFGRYLSGWHATGSDVGQKIWCDPWSSQACGKVSVCVIGGNGLTASIYMRMLSLLVDLVR